MNLCCSAPEIDPAFGRFSGNDDGFLPLGDPGAHDAVVGCQDDIGLGIHHPVTLCATVIEDGEDVVVEAHLLPPAADDEKTRKYNCRYSHGVPPGIGSEHDKGRTQRAKREVGGEGTEDGKLCVRRRTKKKYPITVMKVPQGRSDNSGKDSSNPQS